jgi:uncharacterized OsmC-like protein
MSQLFNFSVNGESKTATKYEGRSRQFTLVVDEPNALGGEDEAPNPVEYILAGYAGCLNVVINLIAKELDIVVQSLNINVNGDINPARLFGQSYVERAGFLGLQVDINIETAANEKQLSELFALVKERCPVNDNLSNITPVNYTITRENLILN